MADFKEKFDPPIRLDRYTREDIAKEMNRVFCMIGSKIVITCDSHAIQVIVFPPRDTHFQVPLGPYTGTIKDGVYDE